MSNIERHDFQFLSPSFHENITKTLIMYHINTNAHVHLMGDNQSVDTEGVQYINFSFDFIYSAKICLY